MAYGIPGRYSKHRQFDPDNGKHVPGRCHIGAESGLRKLMRAARRGIVPFDRAFVIGDAMMNAARNPERWLSSHARRRLAAAS